MRGTLSEVIARRCESHRDVKTDEWEAERVKEARPFYTCSSAPMSQVTQQPQLTGSEGEHIPFTLKSVHPPSYTVDTMR